MTELEEYAYSFLAKQLYQQIRTRIHAECEAFTRPELRFYRASLKQALEQLVLAPPIQLEGHPVIAEIIRELEEEECLSIDYLSKFYETLHMYSGGLPADLTAKTVKPRLEKELRLLKAEDQQTYLRELRLALTDLDSWVTEQGWRQWRKTLTKTDRRDSRFIPKSLR